MTTTSVGAPPAVRRVLVTGGAGNVAGWLVRTAPDGVEIHVTEHTTPVPDDVRARATVHRVDLRERASTRRTIVDVHPDVVVHAAYAQAERAAIVDVTSHVSASAREVGAPLVHLSTDVVFAGDAPPYGEDATPDPVTDYGRWKAEAERLLAAELPDACIVRTSLVVSFDPLDVSTRAFAVALRERPRVPMFVDEMRQPIRAEDLAAELWALLRLSREERAGVWHLAGPERLDRWELGRRLAARLGLDPTPMVPVAAAEIAPERPRDTELTSVRRQRLGIRLRPVDAG